MLLAIVAIIALLVFCFIHWFTSRKKKNELLYLKQFIEQLEKQISDDNKKHNELIESKNAELEKQKDILTKNNDILISEISNLQSSIEPLSDVFRAILTAIRKDSPQQLNRSIKKLLNESFFNHIYRYVNYTHSQLMEDMKSSETLTKREIDIVCLYLCHLPDSIIQIYANMTNTRSVNKLKKTIAMKLKADDSAKIENLRRF